jgi:hypothetical protein
LETRTYTATYHIRHGVTALGGKLPEQSTVTRTFGASGSLGAVLQAERVAYELADDYLSDPQTGKTTVSLAELREKDSGLVDVLNEVCSRLPPERQDAVRKRFFPDGAHYVVECSWLDHVLKLKTVLEEPAA